MVKRLLFFKDAEVGGKIQYQAGKEYDIDNSTGSADRWIRRLIAQEIEAPIKEEAIPLPVPSIKVEEPKKQKVETKKKKKQDENVDQELVADL